ncbi:MAG TPA: hypothetical protein VL285_11420 [Bryobacteraceae bacterium]|nr:hypothetical protein [Bryobacteraceae bacterium]
MDHPEPVASPTCSVCDMPADLFALQHMDRVEHFCGWSCIMVFAAGKEREFRLYLVGLAEMRSSKLRSTLAKAAANDPSAQIALNQLDEILSAIRAGA